MAICCICNRSMPHRVVPGRPRTFCWRLACHRAARGSKGVPGEMKPMKCRHCLRSFVPTHHRTIYCPRHTDVRDRRKSGLSVKMDLEGLDKGKHPWAVIYTAQNWISPEGGDYLCRTAATALEAVLLAERLRELKYVNVRVEHWQEPSGLVLGPKAVAA